ncbi:polyketide synthase PksL [Microcystis aeruginosa NIES-2520]|jgi:acyl carrier protein|uniref:Polyketide synthase PksL n=4 Tax=Microcystis TaxID=1125 RepID=A0A5A5RJC8_MICAE|nr:MULTISPECIES: acyl carrier protein [Microcystis]MCE2661629.1 acyl carrier protein [Microcystis sp. 53602_E8]MDJ0564361.1 acyl carrier protein [Microcystis sp. M49629_WE12]MBD2621760.1 acyl carrier protein [Microcystis flos-aquae FACHB-1344]MCA2701758.1 acyl carrier protein [Microcystis sp. M179S2]MCZ8045275.1 acyl carrier protein [Microcystis sp. LE19-41.2A]
MMTTVQSPSTVEDIQNWLVDQFAQQLDVDLDDIDIEEPFDNYELDSRKALVLLGRLEKWLGKELNPVVIFNYPTIAELATRLGELYL